ncbi:hypothetical protein [Yeosuana marina]|jgi:hypothetical protein|uniref:hypothetical protein n=1 Tax=Yeosuana marina TaxID=1565536 RepID=UPI0030C8A4DD
MTPCDEAKNLEIITESLLELNDNELINYTSNCDAIASCVVLYAKNQKHIDLKRLNYA